MLHFMYFTKVLEKIVNPWQLMCISFWYWAKFVIIDVKYYLGWYCYFFICTRDNLSNVMNLIQFNKNILLRITTLFLFSSRLKAFNALMTGMNICLATFMSCYHNPVNIHKGQNCLKWYVIYGFAWFAWSSLFSQVL